MRFLCDMGISRKVAEWLRRQGYESSHLGEEGHARLPNGRIFAKAIAEKGAAAGKAKRASAAAAAATAAAAGSKRKTASAKRA